EREERDPRRGARLWLNLLGARLQRSARTGLLHELGRALARRLGGCGRIVRACLHTLRGLLERSLHLILRQAGDGRDPLRGLGIPEALGDLLGGAGGIDVDTALSLNRLAD